MLKNSFAEHNFLDLMNVTASYSGYVIRVCTVDEERHPAHDLDLFRCLALDRFVIIRD